MPPLPEPVHFLSRAHPGDAPWGLVYARAVVRPLAACLLPLMIVTLVAVLQGMSVLPYLVYGYPAAGLLAAAWTSFRLRKTVAEIAVTDGFAVPRTVWEVARSERGEIGRVFDLRDYGRWCFTTIGLASYELEREDWPRYEALREALKAARYADI